MTIRRANQSETHYILQLTGNVLSESSMGHIKNNVHTAYHMFLPYIQNGAYYLIEEENQRLKGWLLLGIDGDFMAGNVIGQLLQIYVFPQYRKMGIGRKLMQEAIRQLQSQGMKKIHLNVFAGNPAKNMYKEFGFKKISTIMELNTEEKDRR
ncbi:hypothetical protein A8F95_14320 [Bacillus wudalianchiensis]|uniref:N-acetyltransferase domain-containing protein n=2 Tax=Pseudobacillus wudalianchiensis TaxID=1743143 RepID=A0A1B9AGE1_9BACI|nr:hypothetical protein A8F95_14320 [Bacillus wudalianchiensis]